MRLIPTQLQLLLFTSFGVRQRSKKALCELLFLVDKQCFKVLYRINSTISRENRLCVKVDPQVPLQLFWGISGFCLNLVINWFDGSLLCKSHFCNDKAYGANEFGHILVWWILKILSQTTTPPSWLGRTLPASLMLQ